MIDPLYAHSKVTTTAAPVIEHSTNRGTLANLAAQLNLNLAMLALLSSENQSATNSSGNLQVEGKAESDEISALSGDDANEYNSDNTWGWNDKMDVNWIDPTTHKRGCPGLEYYLSHEDPKWNNFSGTLQAIQANIANKRLGYDNATTAMQTVLDQLKDTVSSIGSGSTNLMSSILTGTMGIASNLNSVRIN